MSLGFCDDMETRAMDHLPTLLSSAESAGLSPCRCRESVYACRFFVLSYFYQEEMFRVCKTEMFREACARCVVVTAF